MQIDDKFVAVKVPKDLHKHLKAKAKERGMTLGNYLFDCICQYHNIKYVPASVEIPTEKVAAVPEEIQKDIDDMENVEKVEETITEEESDDTDRG